MSETYAPPGPTTAPAVTTKRAAERVTVNLLRQAAAALDETAKLTGNSKTEVINKALQLYALVQSAQNAGGGVWIQDAEKDEPVRARFY